MPRRTREMNREGGRKREKERERKREKERERGTRENERTREKESSREREIVQFPPGTSFTPLVPDSQLQSCARKLTLLHQNHQTHKAFSDHTHITSYKRKSTNSNGPGMLTSTSAYITTKEKN